MSGQRILVVDDDKDVLQFLVGLLRKAGYAVSTAVDPVQAMMQARRQPPDLILTDILMPAGGGFTLVSRLASCGQTSGIPIIVLTGSQAPDLEAQAEAAGVIHLLRKPCDNSALLAAIRESLGEA